jgi:hypothetical protein
MLSAKQSHRWLLLLGVSVSVGAALYAGCASYRPVPAGKQPLAQASVGGVLLTVPRLDAGSYPADVLAISTPVLLIIENHSRSEILVELDQFTLGTPGGTQMQPLQPQLLGESEASLRAEPPRQALIAALGAGVYGGAPPPRLFAMQGSWLAARLPIAAISPARSAAATPPAVRLRVPGWRGGYFTPRSYAYATSRWGAWAGGPLYWGPQWWAGWYGNPWFWPWFFDGPRYYEWSRADAVRLALPIGRLPAGGRTGGFLYFSFIQRVADLPLVLNVTLRDASGQQLLGTAQLALMMRAD